MLLVTCNHSERVAGGDRVVTQEGGCCIKAEVAAFWINLFYEQSDTKNTDTPDLKNDKYLPH